MPRSFPLFWLFAFVLFAPLAVSQQFKPPVYYKVGPTDAGLVGAVAADFNHDGLPDLAVMESNYNRVGVLLNKGKGVFAAPKIFSVGGGAVVTMAVGDLNGDGIPDLLVVATNRPRSRLIIFLGKGDGTFNRTATYALGNGVQSVAVADFNGDHKLDVVATNFSHVYVQVFLGNGDGTLQSPVSYAAPNHATAIAAADLNGDGHPDVLVAGTKGALAVLLNKGDGTFQNPVLYRVGQEATAIAVADLNDDKVPDVVVSAALNQKIYVLLGKGDGTLKGATPYSTRKIGIAPMGVVIADFNHDSKPDLAVTAQATGKNGVGVFYGKGDGTFGPPVSFPLKFNGGDALATADFNQTGGPDLAVTSYFGYTVAVLLNAK